MSHPVSISSDKVNENRFQNDKIVDVAEKILWAKKTGDDYIAKTVSDMAGGYDVKKYAEYKNITFKTVEEGKQQKMTRQYMKKICFDATSLGLGPLNVDSFVLIFHRYSRVFSAIMVCAICGLNLNALSLVYLILGIVAAAQEVVIVHAHNPMVVWQAILRLSFICICV